MKFKEWKFEKNHRAGIASSKGVAWNSVESLGQYESSSEMDGVVFSKPLDNPIAIEGPGEFSQPIGYIDKGKGIDQELHPTYALGEDLRDASLTLALPLSYNSITTYEESTYGSGGASITVPAGPVPISELQTFIERPEADDFVFQILVSKWEPGGDYMRYATDLLCDTTPERLAAIMRSTDTGGNLFKMIHDYLPSNEQVPLIKAMLESHLQPLTAEEWHQYNGPVWARAWHIACRTGSWNEAKNVLTEKSHLINLVAGPLFLDCALVVIAERQCTEFLVRITALTSLNKSFSISLTSEVNKFREQTLVIVDFFNGRDVKPAWDVLLFNIVD